jgi:hypothetical protein
MKIINLPKPTSQCDSTPNLEMRDSDVLIKYSHEDEKSLNTITLKFCIVYGIKYTECEYTDTMEYIHGLAEIENSEWIESFIEAWKLRDRPEDDAFGGERTRLKHYRLYFRDFGMYEVLSKGLEITEE